MSVYDYTNVCPKCGMMCTDLKSCARAQRRARSIKRQIPKPPDEELDMNMKLVTKKRNRRS